VISTSNATIADAVEMAPHMRTVDRHEVMASGGHTPLAALARSIDSSFESYTTRVDGLIACIYGVGAIDPNDRTLGSPWMLGTHVLRDHPATLARLSRAWIDDISSRYVLLVNYVDARNQDSIRWLDWLGFEIHAPTPYGVDLRDFHRFTMETASV
jgi:hypothetical protein